MPRNVLIAHITASVFINDDERGLHADERKLMAFALGNRRNPQIAPIPLSRYRHNRTGEACPGHSVPGTEYQGQRTGTTATPT